METIKRMNWKQLIISHFAMVLVMLFITSCDENEVIENDISNEEEIEIVENNTTTESLSEEDLDISSIAELSLISGNQRTSTEDLCADVSWDETTKTMTIDFGDGCVGPYGRSRSGLMYITYNSEPDQFSSSKVITFENYFVNDKEVKGTIEVDRFEVNESGNYENRFTLIDYTVVFPNEESFTLNGNRTREFLQGIGDDMPLMMKISGGMEGKDTRGRSFVSEIKTPIIADAACSANGGFIRVSGEKETSYMGLNRDKTRTVLYGDGSCDNTIEVIINGTSYTITKE